MIGFGEADHPHNLTKSRASRANSERFNIDEGSEQDHLTPHYLITQHSQPCLK